PDRSEGVELLEEDAARARLLSKDALGRVVERLAHAHEPAGEGGAPAVRVILAADEQRAEAVVDDAEDRDVDAQRGALVRARVVAREELLLRRLSPRCSASLGHFDAPRI